MLDHEHRSQVEDLELESFGPLKLVAYVAVVLGSPCIDNPIHEAPLLDIAMTYLVSSLGHDHVFLSSGYYSYYPLLSTAFALDLKNAHRLDA